MFTIRKRQCERFEPRSHFKSKTLKMTTAQIVETSDCQDYVQPDDQTQPTFVNVSAAHSGHSRLKCFYDQDFKKIRGKFLFVLSFERGAFTMDQLSQRASKQQVGEVNS